MSYRLLENNYSSWLQHINIIIGGTLQPPSVEYMEFTIPTKQNHCVIDWHLLHHRTHPSHLPPPYKHQQWTKINSVTASLPQPMWKRTSRITKGGGGIDILAIVGTRALPHQENSRVEG